MEIRTLFLRCADSAYMSMPLTHQYTIRIGMDCGNVLFCLCWWVAVEHGGLGGYRACSANAKFKAR